MGVPGPTRVSISLRAAVSKRSSFWGNCRCRRLFHHLQWARKGRVAMGIGVGNAHGSKIFHAAPALREIQFKLKMISYRRFNAFCRSAEGMSSEAGAWFIEADHVSVTALARHRRGV